MISRLKIHCYGCGTTWTIQEGEDWKNEKTRTCPGCGKRIDATIWERDLLPGFLSLADANRELEKDSIGFSDIPHFIVNCEAVFHSVK
jgi:DNA-directed RNA polymerase subunit RPC12/RpoP